MNPARTVAALLTAALVALLPMPNASADGRWSGCMDRSPGVVTHWEFQHAKAGMSKAQVECLYGVGPTSRFGFYGRDGRWHELLTYPAAITGAPTDVGFVDDHTDGHGYVLVRKVWYCDLIDCSNL
jgi:hypothetical protein